MKKQTLGQVAALASLAVGLTAMFLPDGAILRGDTLSNCELEIRPRRDTIPGGPIGGQDNWESQLYWEEFKETGVNKYGSTFTIEVPKDSLLIFGDGDASSASLVPLQASKSYVIRAFWDNTMVGTPPKPMGSFYQVSENGGSTFGGARATRSRGSFDSIGLFEEPSSENVHRQDADPEKQRVRIWSSNRGVEIALTLSDA